MPINKNFPNYSKTKPTIKVVSNHPPGPNRASRKADEAWDRKRPMRELRKKHDQMVTTMRDERVKKDRVKWEKSQDKKAKLKTRHD